MVAQEVNRTHSSVFGFTDQPARAGAGRRRNRAVLEFKLPAGAGESGILADSDAGLQVDLKRPRRPVPGLQLLKC